MAVHRKQSVGASDAFKITGAEDLRDLSKSLKAAGPQGKQLRKTLRLGIVAAVKPMQAEAKQNVLSLPVSGKKSTGLRKRIAAATHYRVSVGASPRVRLEVNPAKFPRDKGSGLPGLLENAKPKWRHPLFGDEAHWYGQEAHPYLAPAVAAHLPAVRTQIDKAIEITTAKIERN